jgi:hypothetical protein
MIDFVRDEWFKIVSILFICVSMYFRLNNLEADMNVMKVKCLEVEKDLSFVLSAQKTPVPSEEALRNSKKIVELEFRILALENDRENK